MRKRSLSRPGAAAWTAALFVIAAMAVAAGCYVGGVEGDDGAGNRSTAGASTAFIPADAASQPALPPGAGPYSGPAPSEDQDPPPPPMDSGTTQDASTPPPKDASTDA